MSLLIYHKYVNCFEIGVIMQAYKYISDVDEKGQVKVPAIPQMKSSRVEIIILPIQNENSYDLLNAAESSLDFWNNDKDDQWDNV